MLATGFLPEVWAPDPETAALRQQLARRRQLVRQRTREKNQIHAVLQRNLRRKPPASDLLGASGRAWLAAQELLDHERRTVEASLRHIDFLDVGVAAVDRWVAERVLASPETCRLMQLPGVGAPTAATLMAAIGDITRFPAPRTWSAISASTPRSASRAPSRPSTGGSRSAAPPRFAEC